MHWSLFKFTLVLNCALLFWERLVFEFLLGISEILYSLSALVLKIILLQIASATNVTDRVVDVFGTKLFLLIVFYYLHFLIIEVLLH
jgi:hypothetical protein